MEPDPEPEPLVPRSPDMTIDRTGFHGTGPGPITPDGCAVELWQRLPVAGEVDVIQRSVPPGARILELGSGPGRMTHPLIERGFEVSCVDESAEMLAQIRGARTIRSTIAALDLGETFDVVLLASFLVHAPDPGDRTNLLATCRRHVADDGQVLIQREGQGWHENLPRVRAVGDGVARVLSSESVAPGVRSVHTETVFPDARWTQTFLSRPLSAEEFENALADADLTLTAYLTDDHTWAQATPVTGRL
jgi:SAM-dependent methyltransferase